MAYIVTENSTVNGYGTPHGFNTPHRFPNYLKGSFADIMANLAIDLYPTGRAFTMQKGGVADNMHVALNRSFIRLVNAGLSVLDSNLPDNDNFDKDDCLLWEYRLGLRTNELLPTQDRRDAILRKMSRGRNIPARQGKEYIEYQLRIAGFDVYVHENTFPYQTPEDIISGLSNATQHGGTSQHGIGMQHGATSIQLIANLSTPNESFSVGSENIWATFFIGGAVLGESANIDSNRLGEFRELVLKLKPAHLIAYTFINFV
jgi:hypothetical protein